MKKRNVFKKVIGMVLSIAMLASVGTTVMAEDVGSEVAGKSATKVVYDEKLVLHEGDTVKSRRMVKYDVVSVEKKSASQKAKAELRYIPCTGMNGHQFEFGTDYTCFGLSNGTCKKTVQRFKECTTCTYYEKVGTATVSYHPTFSSGCVFI